MRHRTRAMLLVAALGFVTSQLQAQTLRLHRNGRTFPAGAYVVTQTHDAKSTQRGPDGKTSSQSTKNAFTYDMNYAPPAERNPQSRGRITMKVRRVQVTAGPGGQFTYDSAAAADKQTPILAKQFGSMLGAEARAAVRPCGRIESFAGLSKAWEAFGRANPDLAGVAKMNARMYGDPRLDRMVHRGDFVLAPLFPREQPDQTSRFRLGVIVSLKVGQSWQVKRTVSGIGRQDVEQVHDCKVVRANADRVTVEVTYHINGMKPEFRGETMIMRGGDIKYESQFGFHTASGMLVSVSELLSRTDQVAVRTGGKVRQQTVTLSERNTYTVRRAADQPTVSAIPATVCRPAEAGNRGPAQPVGRDPMEAYPPARPAMGSDRDPAAGREIRPAVDTREIAKVAVKFLWAYKDRDPADMAKYCPKDLADFFLQVAGQGQMHPEYAGIFQKGWRWKAVTAWDGKSILAVRFPAVGKATGGKLTAWVAFGRSSTVAGDEVFVLALQKHGSRWLVRKVLSPDQADFHRLPAQPSRGV